MEASKIDVRERTSASQKLGARDAQKLLGSVTKLIVAKGKNVREFTLGGKPPKDAVAAMLGPTGNLRAPTLRVGKTLLVGFDQEAYQAVLG